MNTVTEPLAKVQFDRQATQYNERWAGWSDETLRRVLEFADPHPNWNVLDVATGTGFTALAFAPSVHNVVGADISPKMLAEATRRAETQNITNVEWVEGAAEALPFANGSFDLVTVRIAPHHFSDVSQFLREVKRVLTPNGVFVLGDTTVPDDNPEAAEWQNRVEKARDGSHNANLSPRQWESLCIDADMKITGMDATSGGIPIQLSAWLETAGCMGDCADSVRQQFSDAPESARKAFQITTDATGETHFVWQRVVLRAVVN